MVISVFYHYAFKTYCLKEVTCLFIMHRFFLDRRRRVHKEIVTEFALCNSSDMAKLIECREKTRVRCKHVTSSTRVYVVACPLTTTGYNCPTPRHEFSHVLCCSLYC